jgi:glucan phosphoethanolaminetransferase (alkaline phosphatase superfamily)
VAGGRVTAVPEHLGVGSAWRNDWLTITSAATIMASLADVALLHRAQSYFTGGFLSVNHISSVPQAVGFTAGSLIADFAACGVIVAFAMWVAARLGAGRRTALSIALVAALLPIAVSDFVSYRLASFLGDTFDLNLMFNLAGRDPAELLAVSSEHLGAVAALAGAGCVLLVGLIVVWRRRRTPSTGHLVAPSFGRAMAMPLLLFVVGVVSTTAFRHADDVLDNGLRRKPSGRVLGSIATTLSDVDRDGFGLLGRPADPAIFDAAIQPYALDVPGNGIDEDGVAGDLPAGTPAYVEPPVPSAPWVSRPDVVLIVLESFRADARGATLAGRPVTPVLDALAARGVSSALAFSHNGYTVQSRHHLFSGSVANLRGTTSLIDDFKAQGYETAYFSGQDEFFGGPALGVGFERADVHYHARDDIDRRYSTFSTPGSLALPSDVVTEKVTRFLRTRSSARPLFLYVNFHDTHFPYHYGGIAPLLPSPVLTQFEITPDRAGAVREMYLNTAANVDRAIGVVLDVARGSLASEPGVLVLSDHGESLFDEGFLGHGYALNTAQTRIPLIAANLPIALPEPFGQSDLRDALNDGLATRGASATPIIERDADRGVFQYLGSVERPAQIGLRFTASQILYDFRTGQVRTSAGPWQRQADLNPAETASFVRLIHLWERMLLARPPAAIDGS